MSGPSAPPDTGRNVTHCVESPLMRQMPGVARVGEFSEFALEVRRTEHHRPAPVLLVNTNLSALRRLEFCLACEGLAVMAAASFELATELTRSMNPALLVADIRLEAFNGLHLACRTRIAHPDLPIILTHPSDDAYFEEQARRIGAAFVVDPMNNPEFLAQVRAAVGELSRIPVAATRQ
jgi:DNA-binding NtrC family response regulator